MNIPTKISRIIIFNLDSFASNGGIRKLIETLHDRIVLICASERFGGKYGSFFHQLKKNLKRSGIKFVTYQSLNLIGFKIAVIVIDFINFILRRSKRIYLVEQMAQKYKIPVIKAKEINDPEIVTLIKNNKPVLIISFYFDQVIRKEIIGIQETDIINVHASMLPRCRGPFPILCSFLEGISGGITIHSIQDEALDTGPVYMQAPYDFDINMDILSHDRKSMLTGADMVIELVRVMEEGTVSPNKQEESGSYMSFPTKRDIEFLESQGIKLFSIKSFLQDLMN